MNAFWNRRKGGHTATTLDTSAEEILLDKLRHAGAATLGGSTQILAIAILHERPHETAHTPSDIASRFVEQYKGPGWIPRELRVLPDTPIAMQRRRDAGKVEAMKANAILADMLVGLAPDEDPASCAAIAFSGDNDALGHTFFAVLAR